MDRDGELEIVRRAYAKAARTSQKKADKMQSGKRAKVPIKVSLRGGSPCELRVDRAG